MTGHDQVHRIQEASTISSIIKIVKIAIRRVNVVPDILYNSKHHWNMKL